MNNIFNLHFTQEELVNVVLNNPIIYNELELELMTLWSELSFYNDEAWAEISVNGKDDVRKVIISLPKTGEIIIRNKLKEDEIAFTKLRQIVESLSGLAVKDVYMVDDEEFEIEFENPIPRPRKHLI
jgi:hypothetical protein